ncbi:MAG: hypothetical protein J5526_03950 [Bacteroidales bacterium]|nr:hypothetical protein [Bacteroidales bacterium]
MKKLLFSCVLLVSVTMLSCTSDEQKARKAAYNYADAMANYKLDEAEKYATEETINTTITTGKALLQFVDTAYIASDTPAKLEVTNMEMTSDTSAVVSFVKNTPIKQDLRFSVEVRKRNGKWLAHSPQNGAESQQR